MLLNFTGLIPWTLFLNFPTKTRFTFFSALVASVLFPFFLHFTQRAFKFALKTFSLVQWAAWILVTTFYVCLYASNFPGFRSNDDVSLVYVLTTGHPSGWHSFSYSLLIESLYFILHHVLMTGVIQVFLISMITGLLLLPVSGWAWRKQIFPSLIVSLIACWPITQGMVLFLNRDSTFSLGLCAFLLFLATRMFWKKEPRFSWIEIAAISFALVVLGDLRQDAKVLVIAFVPLAYLLKLFSNKECLRLGAALAVFSLVLYVAFPIFFEYESYGPSYQLTAYVNPLSDIVHAKGRNAFSKNEIDRIDKVIQFDSLITDYSFNDIAPFHKNGMKPDVSPENFREFKKTARSIIFNNPGLFLKNRLNMILAMLNISKGNCLFYDPPSRRLRPHPFPKLTESYENLLNRIVFDTPFLFHIFFFSFALPLLALVALIFSYKKNPWISFASLLLLSRLPGVFLLSPAGMIKYLASIWLGGWMLLTLDRMMHRI